MNKKLREGASALTLAIIAFVCGVAGGEQEAHAANSHVECGADLDERVAQFDATAARKASPKVSLTVTGQITKSLMIWSDGVVSDAYVIDNAISSSLFGFNGRMTVLPDITAGYLMQINVSDSPSHLVSQGQNGDDPVALPDITLRTNYVYLQSEEYGKLAAGENYSLNEHITTSLMFITGFANTAFAAHGTPYSDAFKLRTKTGASSTFGWGALVANGPRRNDYIRYDSPAAKGFVLTALIGDNDISDIGVTYRSNVGEFQLLGAIDYLHYDAEPTGVAGFLTKWEEAAGTLAIKYTPTGLFMSFWGQAHAYSRDDYTGAGTAGRTADGLSFDDRGHSLGVMLGIEKKFLAFGNTTIYGYYGVFTDMGGNGLDASSLSLAVGGSSAHDYVAGSAVNRIAFGAAQSFDLAALDLYMLTERNSADLTVGDTQTLATKKVSIEDYANVVIGVRIKF